MARLPGVTPEKAGIGVKLAFFFTRRGFREMTGREPERIEPLEMYAHVPFLMNGYGKIEQATAKIKDLDIRHRHLAELKAATMTHCEFCIDMGSQVARRHGLSDEELLALPDEGRLRFRVVSRAPGCAKSGSGVAEAAGFSSAPEAIVRAGVAVASASRRSERLLHVGGRPLVAQVIAGGSPSPSALEEG